MFQVLLIVCFPTHQTFQAAVRVPCGVRNIFTLQPYTSTLGLTTSLCMGYIAFALCLSSQPRPLTQVASCRPSCLRRVARPLSLMRVESHRWHTACP